MRVTLSSNTGKKARASKKKPQLHLYLAIRDIHHQRATNQTPHQLRSVLSWNLLPQIEPQTEVLRHLLIELQPGVLLHRVQVLVVVHHHQRHHQMDEATDRRTTRGREMMIAIIIAVVTDVMNKLEGHLQETMSGEVVTDSPKMANAATAEITVTEMESEIAIIDFLDAVMTVAVAQVAEMIFLLLLDLMIIEDRVLVDLIVVGIRPKKGLIDRHLYVQTTVI